MTQRQQGRICSSEPDRPGRRLAGYPARRAALKEGTMLHPITSRRSVRRQLLATLATAATLTLVTACSSSTATPVSPPAAATTATSAPSTAASTAAGTSASSVAELKTTTSSLGDIVTDGKG